MRLSHELRDQKRENFLASCLSAKMREGNAVSCVCLLCHLKEVSIEIFVAAICDCRGSSFLGGHRPPLQGSLDSGTLSTSWSAIQRAKRSTPLSPAGARRSPLGAATMVCRFKARSVSHSSGEPGNEAKGTEST